MELFRLLDLCSPKTHHVLAFIVVDVVLLLGRDQQVVSVVLEKPLVFGHVLDGRDGAQRDYDVGVLRELLE